MNTLIYRRVSTAKQDSSLDTQEARINDYLRLKGDLLACDDAHGSFSDPDTSGSIEFLQRPGGARLAATIRHLAGSENAVKHVILAKLDRLGRDARDLLNTAKLFDDLGVTLHIVDMGGDSLTSRGPVGKLMFQMLAAFADFERTMIRARIQDKMDLKFERHEFTGGDTAPYGFDLDGATLVSNLAEQANLRRMAARRAGGLSYGRIAAELNRAGVQTKTGRAPWQSGNVANVLNSKTTRRLLADKGGDALANAA